MILKNSYLKSIEQVVLPVLLILFAFIPFGINAQSHDFIDSKSTKTSKGIFFSPHVLVEIDSVLRGQWIKTTADSLIQSNSNLVLELVEPSVYDLPDLKKISYRISGAGKINFSNENIIILLHSSHSNSKIGDIALAITSDKTVYVNFGHVCGNIIHFMHETTELPQNTLDFFTLFVSDTDQSPWQKWNK